MSKFEEIRNQNNSDSEKIHKMELVCHELSTFMDKNPQERVINKINDISDFVTQSQEELESIKNYNENTLNVNVPESTELRVNPNLKIVGLNIDKMIQIVSKFSIRPPKLGRIHSHEQVNVGLKSNDTHPGLQAQMTQSTSQNIGLVP